MRLQFFGLAAALGAALAATSAQAGTVVVPGSASIWLAGQPAGTITSGEFGSDTAPTMSPVLIYVTPGANLTFSVTGSTSVNGGACFDGPNGGVCYPDESVWTPSPWNAEYNGPGDALVGIFLGASGAPIISSNSSGQGPDLVAGPDYQDPSNLPGATNTPQLDQIFLIGDGGGGSETFVAPAGATELYLGVADSLGSSNDNLGALYVGFTGGIAAVPEPATWAMMILGLGLIGVALRRRASATAFA